MLEIDINYDLVKNIFKISSTIAISNLLINFCDIKKVE